MADTQTLRQIAQSRTPFSAWLGVVLLFALFGVIVLAIIGPTQRRSDYEEKRAQDREKKLQELRKQDVAALTSYGWIDKQKGLARVPIEHAMELMVVELGRTKPAPAGPIATPPPESTTAAAGAAAPSSAATPPSSSPAAAPAGTPLGSHGAPAQPAAATNPPAAAPDTQPGASASPAASAPPAAVPAASSSPAKMPSPPGTPLPVRGKTPEGT